MPEENIISLCGHSECADIWWSYLSPMADALLVGGDDRLPNR